MAADEKFDVDTFYERTSEALEEIADEDAGESRTSAEWLLVLGRKLGLRRESDDEEDEDDDDPDDDDADDDEER